MVGVGGGLEIETGFCGQNTMLTNTLRHGYLQLDEVRGLEAGEILDRGRPLVSVAWWLFLSDSWLDGDRMNGWIARIFQRAILLKSLEIRCAPARKVVMSMNVGGVLRSYVSKLDEPQA